MLNLLVVLMVISLVEISLLRLVRTCCSDKPVFFASSFRPVTNDPLGTMIPCHLLSSKFARSRMWIHSANVSGHDAHSQSRSL